ncbi:hypothetical protein AMATHDRAFT_49912 [Amanita thiersii Skay4041]|uniref:Uncharacterized protein n=1 Tax=Amanita thiersii Skay4041 TaxID=703135 RepID=A0A2A9NJS9_9AGAR|nr:hypothetical protein AMATHDRAFT_49912 [Amanita thiersii Skay4041]
MASRSLYRLTTTRCARRVSIPKVIRNVTTSTMHDNDPELLEIEKRRNLSKTQHRTSTPHAHAPGWNESLATESEASVKADKASATSDLQSKTIEYIRARHSSDEGVEPTTADYARDEVMGPLSGAQGREDVADIDSERHVESTVRRAPSVEAFSAGADTMIDETTIHEETSETVKQKTHREEPTPSEENVRADQGKTWG